jgi:deoxyribonuclease V
MRDLDARRWDLSPSDARALQVLLASRVRCEDDLPPVRYVGGVDVSMQRFATEGFAAVVVLEADTMAVVEVASVRMPIELPYIPGLLSFRELPLVLRAWDRLKLKPDLVLVDGHGIAHPRGLGIASHLGLALDVPTIGCAKSILVGRHAELGPLRGDRQPLMYRGQTVGFALRTKDRTNPMFIACGHRVSQETAIRWVLECGRGYRLPEPTRQAHLAANAARRRELQSK